MDQHSSALGEQNALERMNALCASLPDYPGGFSGQGIVIPAGGARYFACAWVCSHMLRRFGCSLPIQLWHLGPAEMTDEMRSLVAPLGVECVDARDIARFHPARILNGWELKSYAILHSPFEEVILLDADNVPVVDPAFLFESGPYQKRGAVFWPDYGRLDATRSIWRLTGVPYRDEPEIETGQIVVSKSRCWGPLQLTRWMNDHSDFWYDHVHGDKETFHMAWRKLEREYAMPSEGIDGLDGVMCQHDFTGRRIFQHRNMHKWTICGENPRIRGFLFEAECLAHLESLELAWKGRPPRPARYLDTSATPAMREKAHSLCGRSWVYRRIGYDERAMTFHLDGRVGRGAAGCEQIWALEETAAVALVLSICGDQGVTCRLEPSGPDRWLGKWLVHERMPVELTATPDSPSHRPVQEDVAS